MVDEKIFCCHGGLSPDLQNLEQIRRIMRPTDVPDTGLLFGEVDFEPVEIFGLSGNFRIHGFLGDSKSTLFPHAISCGQTPIKKCKVGAKTTVAYHSLLAPILRLNF